MIPSKRFSGAILFCTLVCAVAGAQKIPLPFKTDAEKPVVFEIPGEQKAVLFFYTSHSGKFEVCATEVEDTLRVIRTSATLTLEAPPNDPHDDPFKLIGSFSPAGSNRFILFLKMGETVLWEVALDRTSFTLSSAKRLDNPMLETCLGGLEESGKFYLILRQEKYKKSEPKKLIIYETSDGVDFSEHTVTTTLLLNIFDKKFRVANPPQDIEQPAALAAKRRNKIFSAPGKLYIVSDRTFELNGYDNTKTEVVSIDLHQYTLDLWTSYCFDQAQIDKNKTSTYIYDNKLFQLCVKDDYFSLQVTDLADKKTLFSQALLKEDSLSRLFNTEVVIPGRGTLGLERAFVKCDKFSNRFVKFTPFIQVRKSGDDYIVYMGGYEELTSGGSTVGGAPGSPSVPGSGAPGIFVAGGSYERSAYFYTVIHSADFSRSGRLMTNSLQSQLDDMLEQITGFDASNAGNTPLFGKEKGWVDAIFENGSYPILGTYYIGKNTRKTDEYIFKKLQSVQK